MWDRPDLLNGCADALYALAKDKKIGAEEAFNKANDKRRFEEFVK